ncbi:MAG: CPBP family intramembrane metalloprotease [Verrucomicrobia bacterium]|nr:CPBP family intramembrane metalloprotease [Verrucomicrobiota bacterium]
MTEEPPITPPPLPLPLTVAPPWPPLVSPPPLPVPPPPRVWTALTLAGISIPASLTVAGIVQIIAMVALGAFKPGAKSLDLTGTIQRIIEQPWGPAALLLPCQFTMLAAVLGAAWLSPHRFGPRLGYTRSALPGWTLPLLLGGTLFAGGLGGLLTQAFFTEPGPSQRLMIRMLQGVSGPGLVALAILICVIPPVVEETLFRGYLQRRLLQRWHPVTAIATSSAFFTAAHFEPAHMLGVIPVGVWLGVVAWRCGALWPAMLCHAAQNSLAVWSMRHADLTQSGLSAQDLIALAVTGLLAAGAVAAMLRHPPTATRVATVGSPVSPLQEPPPPQSQGAGT